MFHFAPAVVGNTNHSKSVTIIKGFPFAYGFLVIHQPFAAKPQTHILNNSYAKLK